MEISVVIPCFNAGILISAAVASILQQSGEFTVKKIIIVDDSSTDSATALALQSLRKLPMVEILEHSRQKGPGAARNTGIRHVETEWLTFLDADDLFVEHSLEVRALAARKFGECHWIGGDFAILNRDGVQEEPFFRTREVPFRYLETAYHGKTPIRLERPVAVFMDSILTHTCTSLYRTGLIKEIGGFDETLLMAQDYNLFLRLANRADFVFVPEIVMLYRQHETNWTKNVAAVNAWRAQALQNLLYKKEFSEYVWKIKKKVANAYLDSAYGLRKEGKFMAAITASAKSVRYHPFNVQAWSSLAAAVIGR